MPSRKPKPTRKKTTRKPDEHREGSLPPDFLAIGRLTRAVGLRGELECRVGRLGNTGLSAGIECRIGTVLDASVLRLAGVRHYRKRTIVRFEDVATIEAAEKFLGKDLCIRRSAVPLSEGEYLDADLIGLEVRDLDGIPRGRVLRVEHYPAQDCLVLTPGDKLVPMVHAFIRAIDMNAGVIIIDPPPGLLDETGAEIA